MREEFSVNLAVVWLVALVLSGAVVGAALRARRVRPFLASRAAAAVTVAIAGLDLYQVAYLAGGPRRVLDTVLSTMLAAGTVRVPRLGRLGRAGGAPAPAHPLERAVLAALPRRRASSVYKVRGRIATGPAMRELRQHLAERGLYQPEARVTPPLWVVLAAAISAPVILLAVTLLFPPPGVRVDRIAQAFGLTVAAGFLGVGFHPRSREHPAGPTRAGADALEALRAGRAGMVAAQRAAATPVGVALYGLSALPDPAVAAALGAVAGYEVRRTSSGRRYRAGGWGYRRGGFVGGGDASGGWGGGGDGGGGGGGGGV